MMSTHAELDDLALYALGCAEAPVQARIDEHVEHCAVCRNELQRMYSDMGLLAMTAPKTEPSPAVKLRLLSSIATARKQSGDHAAKYAGNQVKGAPFGQTRRVNWWWLTAPVAASLLLAILAGTLFVRNQTLNAEVQVARQQLASAHTQAENAEQVLATINAGDAVRITLVKAASKAQPQLQTIYSRQQRRILLVANNLAPLSPGKAYELWLLPVRAGEAPVAAGVFHPDSKGNAHHTYVLPAEMEAKGFAVTVESDGGSSAPTSTPVFVGLQS